MKNEKDKHNQSLHCPSSVFVQSFRLELVFFRNCFGIGEIDCSIKLLGLCLLQNFAVYTSAKAG